MTYAKRYEKELSEWKFNSDTPKNEQIYNILKEKSVIASIISVADRKIYSFLDGSRIVIDR